MTKYQKSALVASISFLTLITLSLFLYSCGVSSPTGTANSTLTTPSNNQQSSPSNPQSFIIANSQNIRDLTITITASSTYSLFMAEEINASTSLNNASHAELPHTPSNIYTFILSDTTNYIFYLLIQPANSQEQPIIIQLSSNPSPDKQSRINRIINGQNSLTNTTSQNSMMGLNALNTSTTCGVYSTDEYAILVDIFLKSGNRITWIQKRYYDNNAPSIRLATATTYATSVADWYGGIRTFITPLPALPSTPPGYYMFASEASAFGALYRWNYTYYIIKNINFVVIPCSNKPKKLKSIAITPDKLTTIYIHPKKPEAGKPDHGSQQYKAIGTYTDGTTDTIKDITSTGEAIWHSSKTEIAKINGNGLAVPPTPLPTTKPGTTTDIQATSLDPAAPADIKSNIAKLCVECWEVTHIRQNKHVPSTEMPDWVNLPFGRIWTEVYIINPKTGMPIPDGRGSYVVDYYIDAGARDKFSGLKPSIGDVGCHMVCANMVLTAVTNQFVNPKLFQDWLNSVNDQQQNSGNKGFMPGNAINWGVIKNRYISYITSITDEIPMERADVKDAKGNITKAGYTIADSCDRIDKALDNCNMVILRINGNRGQFQGHYVLIISGRAGDYQILDPWYYAGDKDTQTDDLYARYQLYSNAGNNTATFNIITVKQ